MEDVCSECGVPLDGDEFQCNCLRVAKERVLAFKVFWTVVMAGWGLMMLYRYLMGG